MPRCSAPRPPRAISWPSASTTTRACGRSRVRGGPWRRWPIAWRWSRPFAGVDAITVLEETTADALIERVRPDVYVKGADYDPDAGGRDLPEAATLRALDVRVVYVPLLGGRSTSEFIERLRREP